MLILLYIGGVFVYLFTVNGAKRPCARTEVVIIIIC